MQLENNTRRPQMTHTASYSVQIGERGRIVLPAAIRKLLGVTEGDKLVLTVEEDGTIEMLSIRQQVAKMRGVMAHLSPKRKLVEELLQERGEEAARE